MSYYQLSFRPIFYSLKEREEAMNSLSKDKETFQEWIDSIASTHRNMIEQAKWYIYNNWKLIKKWDNYCVTIKGREYSNYDLTKDFPTLKPKTNIQKIRKRIQDKRSRIKWIDIIYDWSDGDLSVAINNKDNWQFLDDDQVIELVLYIEQQLKTQE